MDSIRYAQEGGTGSRAYITEESKSSLPMRRSTQIMRASSKNECKKFPSKWSRRALRTKTYFAAWLCLSAMYLGYLISMQCTYAYDKWNTTLYGGRRELSADETVVMENNITKLLREAVSDLDSDDTVINDAGRNTNPRGNMNVWNNKILTYNKPRRLASVRSDTEHEEESGIDDDGVDKSDEGPSHGDDSTDVDIDVTRIDGVNFGGTPGMKRTAYYLHLWANFMLNMERPMVDCTVVLEADDSLSYLIGYAVGLGQRFGDILDMVSEALEKDEDQKPVALKRLFLERYIIPAYVPPRSHSTLTPTDILQRQRRDARIKMRVDTDLRDDLTVEDTGERSTPPPSGVPDKVVSDAAAVLYGAANRQPSTIRLAEARQVICGIAHNVRNHNAHGRDKEIQGGVEKLKAFLGLYGQQGCCGYASITLRQIVIYTALHAVVEVEGLEGLNYAVQYLRDLSSRVIPKNNWRLRNFVGHSGRTHMYIDYGRYAKHIWVSFQLAILRRGQFLTRELLERIRSKALSILKFYGIEVSPPIANKSNIPRLFNLKTGEIIGIRKRNTTRSSGADLIQDGHVFITMASHQNLIRGRTKTGRRDKQQKKGISTTARTTTKDGTFPLEDVSHSLQQLTEQPSPQHEVPSPPPDEQLSLPHQRRPLSYPPPPPDRRSLRPYQPPLPPYRQPSSPRRQLPYLQPLTSYRNHRSRPLDEIPLPFQEQQLLHYRDPLMNELSMLSQTQPLTRHPQSRQLHNEVETMQRILPHQHVLPQQFGLHVPVAEPAYLSLPPSDIQLARHLQPPSTPFPSTSPQSSSSPIPPSPSSLHSLQPSFLRQSSPPQQASSSQYPRYASYTHLSYEPDHAQYIREITSSQLQSFQTGPSTSRTYTRNYTELTLQPAVEPSSSTYIPPPALPSVPFSNVQPPLQRVASTSEEWSDANGNSRTPFAVHTQLEDVTHLSHEDLRLLEELCTNFLHRD